MTQLKIYTDQIDIRFNIRTSTTPLTSITFFQPCQPISAGKAEKKATFFNHFLLSSNAR
jgi:hypothetical protein